MRIITVATSWALPGPVNAGRSGETRDQETVIRIGESTRRFLSPGPGDESDV